MAKNRMKINAAVQERLGEVAAELRQMIYGEQGFPEWGTNFAQSKESTGRAGGYYSYSYVIFENHGDGS